MSSSVFFKFKSQKEPTRVEFDGTGISVFELKREIINKSGLGDGTDFDLYIYTDDNSEEYDDDTTIVPRSTTVIARRQPAVKPGAGRAARYVSGKMPVAAKNAGRKEQLAKVSASKPNTNAFSQMNDAMTEEDRMAAMFAAQTEQWSAQQEELSHQAPVPFGKPGSKRPANVPDHDPPNGYICYRCGNKGHWIQLCPTNDDPDFDNRPRVKRTTGIPRSFLQKVDKSVILAQSEGDETKRPSGIMVNAEGDFVIAEPDRASWEQFQAKAKSSSAAAKTAQAEDKEMQERGLECSIDKKMFIEPMKTPCCQKTFCNDCITNALIESDFVCPACQTEGVLIDDLQPDEEVSKKVQEYLKEKEAAKVTPPSSPKGNSEEVTGNSENDQAKEAANTEDGAANAAEDKTRRKSIESTEQKPNSPATESVDSASKSPSAESKSLVPSSQAADGKTEVVKAEDVVSKKRPAEDFLENPKIPKGPRAMQNQQSQNMMNGNMMNGMPNMGMNNMMFNGGMGMMPNMMGMGGMGMNMGMNMGFNNMNGGYGNMNGGYGMNNNMNGMNNMNMNGGGMNNNWGMNNASGMNGMNTMGGMSGGMNGMNGGGMMNGFQNGGNFTQGGGEDDAYFRKPVNPHRHQNKQRRVRPSDYREL
ncbi:DWNN domain-containing protein [Trichoderma breve]|uniref:DWNN domain-containing protein n=1 Tax=Trichoderma breve TaxID=2034170 RepID=A0A9W9BI24_9HYPO|nr:DWNN domain-containing protein [Trichoderma breve]KAJ4860263.1 DWNN domain-containing protein [Trichoderma breve]